MKRKIVVLIAVVLLAVGYGVFRYQNRLPRVYAVTQPEKKRSVETVSMAGLLADPLKFAGKHVKTAGWVRFGFENYALYFHAEDDKRHLPINAVGLSLNVNVKTEDWVAAAFDRTYCVVEGDFCPRGPLNLDLFSGYITNISYMAKIDR